MMVIIRVDICLLIVVFVLTRRGVFLGMWDMILRLRLTWILLWIVCFTCWRLLNLILILIPVALGRLMRLLVNMGLFLLMTLMTTCNGSRVILLRLIALSTLVRLLISGMSMGLFMRRITRTSGSARMTTPCLCVVRVLLVIIVGMCSVR